MIVKKLDCEKLDQIVEDRYSEQQAIGPIENTTMAGDKIAGILQANLAFDQRLRKIAKRTNDATHKPKQRTLKQRNWQAQQQYTQDPSENCADHATCRAFPRLLGTEDRRQLVAAEAAPNKIGRGILEPGDRARVVDPSNTRLHAQLLEDRIVQCRRVQRSQQNE